MCTTWSGFCDDVDDDDDTTTNNNNNLLIFFSNRLKPIYCSVGILYQKLTYFIGWLFTSFSQYITSLLHIVGI